MCSSYVVKFYRLLRKNISVGFKTNEAQDKVEENLFQERYSFRRASIAGDSEELRTTTIIESRSKDLERKQSSVKDYERRVRVSDESEEEDCEDVNTAIDFRIESEIVTTEEKIVSDILRKDGKERSSDELERLDEELVRIKALNHLSNSVRKELASVIFMHHDFQNGDVVFEQGDEGNTWYIIWKGYVHVSIRGKGMVTTLYAGDEFGQLALVNEAPRAATIVVGTDGTQLLQVNKSDFNRILRDVEANILRLKEHGKDVLVLETSRNADSNIQYSVIEGCPWKMVEYILETHLDKHSRETTDLFLEDFLLTHIIFLSTRHLISELRKQFIYSTFRIDAEKSVDEDILKTTRRRVVNFLYWWTKTIGFPIFQESQTHLFIAEVYDEIQTKESYSDVMDIMIEVIQHQNFHSAVNEKSKLWNCILSPHPICLSSFDESDTLDIHESLLHKRSPIRPNDYVIFRVHSIGHTYCTVRVQVRSAVQDIKHVVTETCGLKRDDLLMLELKSSGEKVQFQEKDRSIITSLSLNGRIFIASKLHLDALTCLPEQERDALDLEQNDLQAYSTRLLAYHISLFDWSLFKCIHEYEFIYRTWSRDRIHCEKIITSNLDVFVRRFNQIQFWVASTICTTPNAEKRIAILRKFIKLAMYCREYQNLNGCFAILMGLSNSAVTRLQQTWNKLPTKSRRNFSDLERLMEPSRNHRPYRLALNKLSPPFIPLIPLILKDITFIQDGNKNYISVKGNENNERPLVNFEKMQMIAQVLRNIRYARCKEFSPQVLSGGNKDDENIASFVQNIRCIDKQEILHQLSLSIQPRLLTQQQGVSLS